MRHPTFIALAAFTLLLVDATSPVIAARYPLQGCHWGYSNNCRFSSYRQCLQDNIWADLLCLCTPASATTPYRMRRGAHHKHYSELISNERQNLVSIGQRTAVLT